MILLAIDTAAPVLQLALRDAEDGVEIWSEPIERGHAELLFPRIATLLERCGARYRDLERVAVTTGPGSFTGVRIGLAAARGLGLALDIPVLGIPSLVALSLDGPDREPFTVRLDARRGEDYVQSFSAPGRPTGTPQAVPKAQQTDGPVVVGRHAPIAALARFAAGADPALFPPDAAYVRGADAKPQDRARVALRETGA